MEDALFVVSGVVTGKHEFDSHFSQIRTNQEGKLVRTGLPRVFRTVYEFKVYTVWKGELNEVIYLNVLESRDNCGNWSSSVGQEWLLYGPPGLCGQTTWLQSAHQDITELGEGSSPIPGTSAPIPQILQETMRNLKLGVEKSTTPELMSATPSETHVNESPTSAPQKAAPTRTPEAVAPAPLKVTAAPSLIPATATPAGTPQTLKQAPTPVAAPTMATRELASPPAEAEAAEGQASLLRLLAVLGSVAALAALGLLALARARRSRRIAE